MPHGPLPHGRGSVFIEGYHKNAPLELKGDIGMPKAQEACASGCHWHFASAKHDSPGGGAPTTPIK